VPGSTTIPAAPPTTIDPVRLAALVRGLHGDLARIQAVTALLSARAVAGQLPAASGQPATTAPADPGTDPDLVDAAAAELRATGIRDASAERFNQARHRLSEVALTLYMEGGATGGSGSAALGAVHRSVMLGMVLADEEGQIELAKRDRASTTADFLRAQRRAQQLVDAHAAALQAATQAAAVLAVSPSPGPVPSTAAGTPTSGPRPVSKLPLGLQGLSPTIVGPTMLTAAELVGWYAASGHQPHLTVPVPALAQEYVSLGAADGIRADIAFAQSVLETGYFGFPSNGQVATADNNFAGIGACDSCTTGRSFPDAHTGVAAQLQLLHGYATTAPMAGPMAAPAWVTGCCPTWMDLTGIWATATDYGYRILKIYRDMVDWALARRSAAAGL
jgi:hypothetical protein